MARTKQAAPVVVAEVESNRKYAQIGVSVLPDIADLLTRIADERSTTRSQLCRQLLTDFAKTHGKNWA